MNRLLRPWAFLALVTLLHGPMSSQAAEDKVALNFVNADIDAVIKTIGQISGRNFLIDPRVKGTINIVSATPIPAAHTYDVLLSALRVNGYTAVEAGGVTKVVPETEGKLQGGALVRKGKARNDQVLTQVFPLKYESAAQALAVVRPLLNPNASVVAAPAFNALVITDYGSSLHRLEKIVAEIDQPVASVPYVIPIQHASAVDIHQALNRLFTDMTNSADKMQRLSMVPDIRTNSLIVRSDNPHYLEQIRSMIQKLDQKTAAGGNIRIIYLKNAEATQVAKTLRGILSGGGNTSSTPVAGTTATPNTANTSNSASQSDTAGNGSIIQADAASNALIITAPDAIYNNLRGIVEKLDVRRAQVHVEALIVEVTADKAAEFGIQWQDLSGASKSTTQVIGGTNFSKRGSGGNIIDAATNLGTVGKGLNVGVMRGQVTLPGVGQVLNLGVLARALESDSNANILSTPNLLTLDNEEAKIVIGQNVPFITGQYAQTAGSTTATPFQTIERKDVGLTLKIKPQISEGGSIKLLIFQEVSSVQDKTNAAGVITNKRSIESTVIVDDAQIIALGGLVQDSITDDTEKVPLLGDVPLFGHLFKTETRKRTKTNLMVFLRPTILRDAKSYAHLTDQRYREILEVQTSLTPKWHPILPDMEGMTLKLTPAPQLTAPTPPAAGIPASRTSGE